MLDYYQIGQRIRKIRKARGLSQEELAARVDISVPHMSHIETGNTKLSLPVLADLALALEVRADDLLFDHESLNTSAASDDICTVLECCTAQQAKVIVDIVKATKMALDKNY